MTDITELAQREKFEAWVITQICISKSTLEGLRTSDGYCNSTLSGRDYNLMWNLWKAAGAELVEALEKAKGMETYWKTQCRGITDHCEVLQARIAELESHKAALLKFIRDSCYVFDGAGEDISDAYVDAITSGLMPKLESVAACNPPLFWVRVKSDGGYEGPIHDSKLEEVRKKSGEWLPLTLAGGIPELEPRTVKLPAERFCPAEYAGSQLWLETEVWNKAITACADALRADGIKVEVE
ncbi:TPA: hypothetical protein ACXRZE_001366 [Klebsiella variicola subsp. variicola]